LIVVDTSVWIDFLYGRNAPHVAALRASLGRDEIILGDLMLCEVLQGLDGEAEARQVEALLRSFDIVPMAGDASRGHGRPQLPCLAPTRDHHPKDDRPSDWHLVYRASLAAVA
jgi:predicted nucleic acid-binding protein